MLSTGGDWSARCLILQVTSETGTGDFRILKGKRVKSKSTTLNLVRADFSLFIGLLVESHWIR